MCSSVPSAYTSESLLTSPDNEGNQRMELLLPDAPQPAIPITNPVIRARYANVPRRYDMRLTSSTQDTYGKNLYTFQERLVDEDDTGSHISVDDDDDVVLATGDSPSKSKGNAPPRRARKKRAHKLTRSCFAHRLCFQ